MDGQFITTEGNGSSGADTLQRDAAVDLPASLFHKLDDRTSIGIFFGLYETASLFPIGGKNSSLRTTELYSQVLAVTVGKNLTIQNLEHPIVVLFKTHNKEGRVSKIYLHINSVSD